MLYSHGIIKLPKFVLLLPDIEVELQNCFFNKPTVCEKNRATYLIIMLPEL